MRACKSMTKISIIITLFIAFTVFCLVCVLGDWKVEGFYLAILGVGVMMSIASVTVLVFRATMLTWITVLVLLAFAGNRRRVLVQRGRRITIDVAWYLVSLIFESHKGPLDE
ncbi:hypothetical protein RJT34_33258 [Clitoria ternatea]|uniref:Uncharacterized protein n=1 Tax=Clitoria ternatea TaxID=43366 RepID=A0AAN9EZU1_CLITE